jgi:lipoyl(octanoyl) transferase
MQPMTGADPSSPELWVCHLGTVPYREALDLQGRIRARRQAQELPDTLLLLEHPPVYTRGRRSDPAELALPSPSPSPSGKRHHRAQGIEVVDTDRGGKVTYHGPGQLVGYPIMRIGDIHNYLRTMEAAIVAALAEEGVRARTRWEEGRDYTGVWVRERKIASIGVHVSRGVTTHGFAVNVDDDLEPFEWIVACGLPGVRMTSLAQELTLGRTADLSCFRRRMAHSFCQAHGRRQRLVSPRRLGIEDMGVPAPTEIRRAAIPA